MADIDLDAIAARAEAAKSVTGDDALEVNLAWVANWQATGYEVSGRNTDGHTVPYALCVAEESAELLIHAHADVPALVAEVRRLRETVHRVRAWSSRWFLFGARDELMAILDDPGYRVASSDADEAGGSDG